MGRKTLQIFQKKFPSPGPQTKDVNISWLINFFGKYLIAPPINFSFFFKAFFYQYFRVVLTVIFKFQITKEINIQNNIRKIIFKKSSKKPLILFAVLKFFYNHKTKIYFQKNHHQLFNNQSIELSSSSETENTIQQGEVIFKKTPQQVYQKYQG